jgi:hypothetical protein
MKLQHSVSFIVTLGILALPTRSVSGFRTIFQRRRINNNSNNNTNKPTATTRKINSDYEVVTTPATSPAALGLEYMPPNVVELFDQIQHVSPLAKMAIENEQRNFGGSVGCDSVMSVPKLEPRGFDALPQMDDSSWKIVEKSRCGVVKHVDRIDTFNGVDAPLLRFRVTLDGPCVADPLASLIMDLEERSKWDVQIQDVFEAHKIQDLPSANAAMGFAYGNCYRLGVGYCRTKKNLGIDSREQLTLCGINKFLDGSSMIWGVELPDRYAFAVVFGMFCFVYMLQRSTHSPSPCVFPDTTI